jgi:undecaprenyl diphosphate synthase
MSTNFATQSTLHAAIIMDGNGRWALARGLPRVAGHRAGVEAARRVVEAAPQNGIGVLTLFAFSSDNWQREPVEVGSLMRLLAWYLESQTAGAVAAGMRVEAIGRRDRLPGPLAAVIAATEAATAHGTKLRLRVALDYSGRDAILAAAGGASELSRAGIDRRLGPPVDLLIRTGGERRLSDFLLWESAYAELVFSRVLWPDFDAAELAAAVRDFRTRDRRFGAVPPPTVRCSMGWLD